MARRRGRPLDDEEKALWAAVKRTAVPLRPDPMPAPPEVIAEPPAAEAEAEVRLPASQPVARLPRQAPRLPTLSALGRSEKHAIQRGRTAIDGRLDLHGYRQDEAHARLSGFLGHAQASGWKLVLVITGKGRPGGDFTHLHAEERGVLRRVVPLWLSLPEFRRYVLGYDEAGAPHGGGGALYVRIRRRKER